MELKIIDEKINFFIEMSKEETQALHTASNLLTQLAESVSDKGLNCLEIDGLTYSVQELKEMAGDLTALSLTSEGYAFYDVWEEYKP